MLLAEEETVPVPDVECDVVERLYAQEYGVKSFKDLRRWVRFFIFGFDGKNMEDQYLKSRVPHVMTMWVCQGLLSILSNVTTLVSRGFRDSALPWWILVLDVTCLLQMAGSVLIFMSLWSRTLKVMTKSPNLLLILISVIMMTHLYRVILVTPYLNIYNTGRHTIVMFYVIFMITTRLFVCRHSFLLSAFMMISYGVSLPWLPHEFVSQGAELWRDIFAWITTAFFLAACFHEYFERNTFLVQVQLKAENKARRHAEELAIRQKAETLTTIAKMSHEIRTPLGCLLGLNDLLMSSTCEEEKIEFSRTIQSSGTHLLQLLNDILDYSKLRVGKVTLRESWVNPISELATCVELFKGELAKKGLTLDLKMDTSFEYQMNWDSTRVHQICTNFLSNAIKFTPQRGTITFKVEFTADPLRPHGRILDVGITDTGVGMQKDECDRLFEEFYQVDSTRTRSTGGAGLGLSIALNLAKIMGGIVGVDSEINKGSTFWFRCFFPTQLENTIQNPRRNPLTDPPQMPDLSRLHVLLVDDTPMNVKIYSAQLERWGCSVTTAYSGEDAISIVDNHDSEIDAIIMDVHMPGMDGLEASRSIAEQHPGILIFGLTADYTVDASLACMREIFYKPLVRRHVEKINAYRNASNSAYLTASDAASLVSIISA